MRSKTTYVCSNCGAESSKWLGRCVSCGEWNTLEEREVVVRQSKTSREVLEHEAVSAKLGDIEVKNIRRLSTGLGEVDLALGGGFLPDQVALFSGEPGVGKSTLLLQIIVNLSNLGIPTLYVSGEESASQVASRAARLFPKTSYANVDFTSGAGVHNLAAEISAKKPRFVVVDSIQTVFDEHLSSLPGSLTQVKAAASVLVSLAKRQGFVLVLVGHINKSGNIAGPKALEHLVDTVLQLEGEQDGQYRLLRSLKNRFGPTGEVGLLVMTEGGLEDMDAKHNILAGSSEAGVGIAKTLSVEGNRAFVVEVQALTNDTVFAYPKRVAEGISVSRLQLICAILERFAGARLGGKDVYVRTTGGYKLSSPFSDLAIAAAILSSINNKEISAQKLFVGELSLSGRVTAAARLLSKLRNISKQGIKVVCLPKAKIAEKGIKIQEVNIVRDIIK